MLVIARTTYLRIFKYSAFACSGEDLVPEPTRQIEAVTGSGTGKDQDGGARTADRHAVFAVRPSRVLPVTGGRLGARADRARSPLQSAGRRDCVARGRSGSSQLRRLDTDRSQRRRYCVSTLAEHRMFDYAPSST